MDFSAALSVSLKAAPRIGVVDDPALIIIRGSNLSSENEHK